MVKVERLSPLQFSKRFKSPLILNAIFTVIRMSFFGGHLSIPGGARVNTKFPWVVG